MLQHDADALFIEATLDPLSECERMLILYPWSNLLAINQIKVDNLTSLGRCSMMENCIRIEMDKQEILKYSCKVDPCDIW